MCARGRAGFGDPLHCLRRSVAASQKSSWRRLPPVPLSRDCCDSWGEAADVERAPPGLCMGARRVFASLAPRSWVSASAFHWGRREAGYLEWLAREGAAAAKLLGSKAAEGVA